MQFNGMLGPISASWLAGAAGLNRLHTESVLFGTEEGRTTRLLSDDETSPHAGRSAVSNKLGATLDVH
jgi:hypothetical protein